MNERTQLLLAITAAALFSSPLAHGDWTAPAAGNGQPIPIINQGNVGNLGGVTAISNNAVYTIAANEGIQAIDPMH